MDIEKIMSIDVNNIKEKQYEALKEHILNILKTVTQLIENDEFDKADEYFNQCQCYESFIDFGYRHSDGSYSPLHIEEACRNLKNLKSGKTFFRDDN
jgi:hypothetical protein